MGFNVYLWLSLDQWNTDKNVTSTQVKFNLRGDEKKVLPQIPQNFKGHIKFSFYDHWEKMHHTLAFHF